MMKNMKLIGILLIAVGLLGLLIPILGGNGLAVGTIVWAGAALILGVAFILWYKQKSENPEIEQESAASPAGKKETLKFYDVKNKKSFVSSEYEIRKKNNRYFAVSPSPNGSHECWRIIKNSKASSLMKQA
jgi:hypothetical protein